MSDPVARKAYYSIGEVCELTGLKPHVLRYWETQFSVLNPTKNRSGNRVYQPPEIKLILLVKHLLYEEKYTIEGARRKLERLRRGEGRHEPLERVLQPEFLAGIKKDLSELLELLTPKDPAASGRPGVP
ncbi:MAG: MerR family transcriptional regulator [Gemmatimonadetes bacterium]|nr:MerR family transcriptional regulator [Gemmatimonadota bacterium]